MTRRLRKLALLALAAAAIAGCSTAEYTTTHARDDLVRLGWTKTEAKCFVDGVRSYYARRYVEANKRENERRGIPFTGVNPRGSDLYVRNELSSGGSLGSSEQAEARALAQRCRA